MILTRELSWQPSARDLAWAKILIAGLSNNGIWCSNNGTMVVDHDAKTFTVMAKTPWFESAIHDKTIKTFAKLGYKVLEGKTQNA